MGILSLEILNLTSSISSALSCFALEYAIRKVQETNLGLDINDTHQVLIYADDVNLIGHNDIKQWEKKVELLLNACRDIGLAMLPLSPWIHDLRPKKALH